MNSKNVFTIAGGVALGLLLAWWLGLFNHAAPTAAAVTASKAAATTATPTFASSGKPNPRMAVAAPVLPPVPASQAPAAPRPQSAATAIQAAGQDAAFEKVRQQSRVKAMTNNLRQLATAASQYMLDKGVTSASYFDLVGNGTDNYIRTINPVMGEDYSGIFISQTDTQVQIVAPDGTSVTYNM